MPFACVVFTFARPLSPSALPMDDDARSIPSIHPSPSIHILSSFLPLLASSSFFFTCLFAAFTFWYRYVCVLSVWCHSALSLFYIVHNHIPIAFHSFIAPLHSTLHLRLRTRALSCVRGSFRSFVSLCFSSFLVLYLFGVLCCCAVLLWCLCRCVRVGVL